MERIRKVPLKTLLDLVTELYNSGVDFVDISKTETADPDMDGILFSVMESYVDPEYLEDFTNFLEEDDTPNNNITVEKKLSDEDISDLL